MIPKPYIAKWQEHAPWKEFSQVEQDLIISRTLIEIFSDDYLRENSAEFTSDMEALLRPEIKYNQQAAFEWLKNELIERI